MPAISEPVESPVMSELSHEQIDNLGMLSKDQLIALIKRVSGAIWGYAMMDDAQKVEAARLKLYNLGMSSNEAREVVSALDKWFDRTQGKPKQQIEMTGKDGEPLSIRLLAAQERLLKDVTPAKTLALGANITI